MRRFMIDTMFPVLAVLLLAVSTASAGPPVPADGEAEPNTDIGWVDYFDKTRQLFVIEDRSFEWTAGTEFQDTNGRPVSSERFSSDMMVEYIADDGVLVMVKPYDGDTTGYRTNEPPSKEDRSPGEPEASDPGEIGGGIRNEGGVWTN